MSDTGDQRGHLDDDERDEQQPSSTEGAAAEGEYDAGEGSPGHRHPTGEDYPDEAVRFDDPDHPRRQAPPAG